jgi:hypothetical protein
MITYRHAEGVFSAPLHDGLMLLNLQAKVFHELDTVGAHVWEKLAEPLSVAQLVERLAHEYHADASTVEADLEVFVRALSDRGLLVAA